MVGARRSSLAEGQFKGEMELLVCVRCCRQRSTHSRAIRPTRHAPPAESACLWDAVRCLAISELPSGLLQVLPQMQKGSLIRTPSGDPPRTRTWTYCLAVASRHNGT
jgi:hypothetical protein